MLCEKCGKSLDEGMAFCPSCGSAITRESVQRKCRTCGAELIEGADYCGFCGSPVNSYSKMIEEDAPSDIIETRTKRKETTGKKKWGWLIAVIAIIIVALIAASIFQKTGTTVVEKDEGSEYSARPEYSVMNLHLSDSQGRVVINSKGEILTNAEYDSRIEYVGDNGVIAGLANSVTRDGTYLDDLILFIINNGQYIEITNELDGNSSMVFQLCGSGEKLFYRDTDKKIYSYNIDTGEKQEIYENAYLDEVSYHGNIVTFGNGYCKVGDKEPFWGHPFSSYINVSDSGKQIYFNSSYHTTSGNDESDSVDFGVYDATSYKYNNNMPSANIIKTSESVWTSITAFNASHSEVLFNYDGDTYYYNDKDRGTHLICMDSLLYPVEGIRSNRDIDRYLDDYLDNLIVSEWKFWNYIDPDPDVGSNFDSTHSVDSIRNHVYCAFNDDGRYSVSLVYLDNELQLHTLVDTVTSDPVVSNDKNYIWSVSNDTIYRIDLTTDEPICHSMNINGLSCFHEYVDDFPISLPIALTNNGKNAYCIGDTYVDYDLDWLFGTLYYIDFENESTPTRIDNNVAICVSDGREKVYYLSNISPELETGTVYAYSQDHAKEQITDNVWNLFIIDSKLFVTKPSEDYHYDYNLYFLDRDIFRLIIESIDYGTLYQN